METDEERKLRQKEYMKQYYSKNKEKMNRQAKRWKLLNRDKWNEYQAEKARQRYNKSKQQNING